jgi:endonuclease III
VLLHSIAAAADAVLSHIKNIINSVGLVNKQKKNMIERLWFVSQQG